MITKWALVPKKQDIDMDVAWREVWYSKRRCIDDADTQDCYEAMIQASPGAALLAEVLAARDALNSDIRDDELIGDYINRKSVEGTALLAALDKLGPAAEVST